MKRNQPDTIGTMLHDLDRRLRALETSPRLTSASIKDGTLTVRDADDDVRLRIGRLPDGSYGMEQLNDDGDAAVNISTLAFGMRSQQVLDAVTKDDSSPSFDDLAGSPGPEVEVEVGTAGRMLVLLNCSLSALAGQQALMGFDVDGPTDVAATDSRTIGIQAAFDDTAVLNLGGHYLIEGLDPGTYTVTAKYLVTGPGGTNTTFANRVLTVIPF